MPIYEYRCSNCGTISEFLVGMGSKNQSLSCKQCGSPKLEKMISVSNSSKGEKRQSGHTCCGKEERCSTPPCSTGGSCRRD
jgi:putative FmdB family regulatory protein